MTLDVTISGTSSDSYATLAEADTLLADRQWFSATWTAFSDATKEKWLREAVRSLDRISYWRGDISEDTQRLTFPRDIGDSTYYPSDEMHRNIKEAQCELVVLLQAKQDSTTGDIELRTESSVGALSGAVSVNYVRKINASGLEKAQGGNIASVYALMAPWRGAKFIER
jgi:hypothetical protein